ncbi:hypothetical protein [Actinomyces israelii]
MSQGTRRVHRPPPSLPVRVRRQRNRTDLDEEGAPSTLDTSANVKQTAHVKGA